MPETYASTSSPFAGASGGGSRLGTAEARALLRECFAQYRARLLDAARSSLDMATDLFEWNSHVADHEVEAFKARRGDWLERFGRTIDELYERRIAGQRRKGRRPDAGALGLNVRMLTDFDHAKQAALVDAMQHLIRYTRRDAAALDQRFAALAPEHHAIDIDNPFAPLYVVDAIGVTSRAIYPDPRIWRPLMERMLTDIVPSVNKIYIALNRLLADHEVLPEINAALRARSELRPAEDTELLPAFKRLLANAGMSGSAGGSASIPGARFDRTVLPPATIVATLVALSASRSSTAPNAPGGAAHPSAGAFPDLDPLLAFGGTAPMIKSLTALQRLDLPTEILREAERSFGAKPGATLPRNLVPYAREMLGAAVTNPAEQTTLDVVALLFEYVFRDPSIPDALRPLLGRLQIPILKAALIDPAFFHDTKNAARRVLDHLAATTVGATDDPAYCGALEALATDLTDDVCRRFEIDISVFAEGDERILQFAEGELRKTAAAVGADIRSAAAAEKDESDRGRVRALIRDRFAGLDVPITVRSFAETAWADYLTQLRKEHGEHSVVAGEALSRLDDLLWSVVAKERTAQKARLAKMIPTLVGGLRKGCQAVRLQEDRAKTFFDDLYHLHIAAIKPAAADATRATPLSPAIAAGGGAARQAPGTLGIAQASIHDFVNEMVPGTWLAFQIERGSISARLVWKGTLRMSYIFASRSGLNVFVYTPEELAHALLNGRVALILEPVPLFDRAVSSALNALAVRRTPGEGDHADLAAV
jgi:hypothetical protein